MNDQKTEKCKARIYHGIGFFEHHCSRRAWRDGFCKQHHPDTVKARAEKRAAKYAAKYKAKKAVWEVRRKAEDIQRRKLELYPELVAALQSMTGKTPLLDRVYEIERDSKEDGHD